MKNKAKEICCKISLFVIIGSLLVLPTVTAFAQDAKKVEQTAQVAKTERKNEIQKSQTETREIPDVQEEWSNGQGWEDWENYDRFDTAAKGCIIMEAQTGRVLYGNNIHGRLPMASTTKIMGAMMALEEPDLDSYFEVDKDAIHVEGSSMGLQEGDQVSLRALAYGMLLPSGNDAANVVGVRLSGSVEAFVEDMNIRAKELGLNNTHYVTACGLDADEHYSSAFDLAKLTRIAMQNPEFAHIAGQYKAQVKFGNPPYDRWLKNHNKLLEMYKDCVGVKTGFTDAARRCLVSAATRNGMTLICVTLNASDDWNIHMSLYDKYFEEFKMEDLTQRIEMPSIKVAGGQQETIALQPQWDGNVPLKKGEAELVTCQVLADPMVYAPIKKGDVLGEAIFMLEEAELCRVPLVAYADTMERVPYQDSSNTIFGKLRQFLKLN